MKVIAKSVWFAASLSGTKDIYKIYAEIFREAYHLRRILEEAQAMGRDSFGGNARSERQIMSKQARASHPIYSLLLTEIEGFDSLAELALDMRWSWNHATDEVWRQQWAEAYSPEVGWALGDGQEHGEDPAWDAAEAEALYDLLEQQVIPEFYTRGENRIPAAWVARMRESMARLTPAFAASRAVREYTEQHYLPAAAGYRERAANKGAMGRQLVDWRRQVEGKWDSLRFGHLRVETNAGHHVFEVEIFLSDLDPNAARVELYSDGVGGDDPVRVEMKCARSLPGPSRPSLYQATVPTTRPARDYTARVVPAAIRGGGSVGVRSNPMATMMKTDQHELHGYIPQTSEHSDVQTGTPLP